MIILRLGANFYPDMLIDEYSALIWTENYRHGEFRLKTGDVDKVRLALPRGSLISLMDTREVMIVETHAIEEDDDGKVVLTVTGRSFETFLEDRIARKWSANGRAASLHDTGGADNYWTFPDSTNAQVVQALIAYWTKDLRGGFESLQIPNYDVKIHSSVTDGFLQTNDMTVELGTIAERVDDFLVLGNWGIRNERPTGMGSSNPLTTYVYKGIDRSTTVKMSTAFGHIKKAKYLSSIKDHKSVVWGFGYYLFDTARLPEYVSNTGINERVGLVEASDIKTPVGTVNVGFDRRLVKYAKEHRDLKMVSGEISPDAPFLYGVHYFLGDIVTIKGDYGIDQKMRIAGYTRIYDEEGVKAVPTLEEL